MYLRRSELKSKSFGPAFYRLPRSIPVMSSAIAR
jgi:hypothetical protein